MATCTALWVMGWRHGGSRAKAGMAGGPVHAEFPGAIHAHQMPAQIARQRFTLVKISGMQREQVSEQVNMPVSLARAQVTLAHAAMAIRPWVASGVIIDKLGPPGHVGPQFGSDGKPLSLGHEAVPVEQQRGEPANLPGRQRVQRTPGFQVAGEMRVMPDAILHHPLTRASLAANPACVPIIHLRFIRHQESVPR